MIEFILGPAGSGKTCQITERILADLAAGRHVMLLVPEQAAVKAESAICTEAQQRHIPQTELEILNFRRLCNRVFREYGGIAYHAVTPGAKTLLLWEALFATAPYLKQYATAIEDAKRFIPLLQSAIGECKAYGITASQLEEAAKTCSDDNPRLSEKLTDLSLLYAEYTRLLTAGYEDPADDLTRLDNILAKHHFFEGMSLYLDAFVGFTPQEYRILSHAFRQADSVCLTFCIQATQDNMAFEDANEELHKLIRLCAPKRPTVTTLTETYRFLAAELAYLEKNLWTMSHTVPYEKESPAIRTVIATGLYDEAEFVANDITKRLHEGASYHDFAVIARNIEDYHGVIDAIFQKYDLPCHISKRLALAEKPIFKLVLSALAVKTNGWNTEDVVIFLKTGLTPFSADACDELESYASRWKIRGRVWYTDEDWFMNPDGYTDQLTDEGRALLARVNATRKQLVAPLSKLHESFDGTRTMTEVCHAIYQFLLELDVPNRLSKCGSDDEIHLWNRFCDVLDTMIEILPDKKADASLFSGLLDLVVSQTDIGTLPTAVDEITVGSADRIRADHIRHVYLLGVNEGVFPAAYGDSGLFSDTEKATLETFGIILSPDSNRASLAELFRFYTAITTASHSVTVICSRCDLSGTPLKPSLAFERIRTLFPKSPCLDTSKMPWDAKITNKKASFELVSLLSGTEEGEALQRLYLADPNYAPLLDKNRQPLITEEESLNEETAKAIFGGDLALTQSRLDSYVLCAFGYECTYVLKLKEQKRAEFRASDTGTFIHRILEKFFSAITLETGSVPPLSEREIDTLLDDILEEYLSAIFGSRHEEQLSGRALQLFIRLRRSVRILILNLMEEFEQSDFVPVFFEMPITKSGAPGTVAPLAIPLPDGTHAYIYGVADRVDICQKGDDVYVRVVDYKTGSKDFSLLDISLGLNLQMLLYLFSIWKDQNGAFRRAVGCKGEILPAGVLYCTAKTAEVSATPDMNDAEIYERAASTLKRKGLLLHDEEILRMMEKKLSGKYIPVTIKKDGTLSTTLTLESLEGFGRLMDEIIGIVAKLAGEIKAGTASCRPLKNAKHDGCRFCPHKSICRNPQAFVTTQAF